jgi:hypothetical protein
MKRLTNITLIILFNCTVYGQLNILYFQSNFNKLSVKEIEKIQIDSRIGQYAVINIEMKDDKGALLSKIAFNQFPLVIGRNTISLSSPNQIKYTNHFLSQMLMQDILNKHGEYEICIEIYSEDENTLYASQCFPFIINPPIPIELNSPDNKAVLNTTRPDLSWIPPVPIYPNTQYHLVLVEKPINSTCNEAMNMLNPIINKKEIRATQIGYPSESPSLELGKQYCWRVSAHDLNSEYSRSEDWIMEVAKEEIGGSIPLIDDIHNKHIVLQSKTFNFKIDHRENTKKLEIFVKTKDEKVIKLDNDIFLKYGMNTIELDNAKFQKGVIYKIEVLNLNNKNYQWEVILE